MQFNSGDIVKVLIPNVVNSGYDYRLNTAAEAGNFVRVSVMNRPYVGVIIGPGDSGLSAVKIKDVREVITGLPGLSKDDLIWIEKMSEWTMMPMGAVLKLIINVPDAFAPPKQEELYSYVPSGRMTSARQLIADAYSSNDNEPMSVSDIQNITHVSSAVVRTMIKNGNLVPVKTRNKEQERGTEYFDTGRVVLNEEQQRAADAIDTDGFKVFLLDGITGSGKTQVYFDSAWRTYASGKSVLLMMPEIALTAQFMHRFENRFGQKPVVWHSNLTAARRREIWRGVAGGNIRIVVGTRSALFLPWQNLGLIVVDEEHDGSYKQEDMGNYHARDMALLRASVSKFPVVLASATPSLETIKNVKTGRYNELRLTSRFGGAQMPTIETVDMREEVRNKEQEQGTKNLSLKLCTAIEQNLAQKQQVMLFINRRGFAPIIQCKKCGWAATCPDCSIGMTYHKRTNKMLCHICGRTESVPSKCPDCGNEVSMRGAGLEKIQEEINEKFPNAKTALVSSDTMMSRQALERLVAQMESGEIDIVIGTQILAKGHHFPNLTLVGVVDADMGLFGADFRAGEHTFQQLFQVAGRAGRGEIPGKVMLQTYQPEHPVMKAICACDRDSFMNNDMAARQSAKMPPFGQLVAIIVECEKENILRDYCAALAAAAPNLNGAKIMGPIAAQVEKIRNWYRMRFLVSGDERAKLQPAVKYWLSKVKQPANVRVKLDVNPQNFM